MFDFPMVESSIWTSLYCFCSYLSILGLNYKRVVVLPYSRFVREQSTKWLLFWISFFFVTQCLRGDFFQFMKIVNEYNFIPGSYNYGEDVYVEIGKFVNKNYLLFRSIIWGGAFVLFCRTAKRMDVPVYYAVIFLFATHAITFAYARVTAAMAVYFFGLSFLCKPLDRFKWIGFIIGALLIWFSREFHNSALIMVIMTISLFVPLRKWIIVFLIISIPIIMLVMKDYLDFIAFANDDIIAKKIQGYTSKDEMEQGVAGVIIRTCQNASFYIPFVLTTFCIFAKNNLATIPDSLIRLYKVMFGLVFVATVFFFLGSSFSVFFYRVLFMSMIPLSIIIPKLYLDGWMGRKYFYWCLMSGIIFLILRYIYDVYISYSMM